MHDKIIHNPKICLELRAIQWPHSTLWLFIDPLDGPIEPWVSISTTSRTTGREWEHWNINWECWKWSKAADCTV